MLFLLPLETKRIECKDNNINTIINNIIESFILPVYTLI